MEPTLFSVLLGSSSITIKAYPFFLALAAVVALLGGIYVARRQRLSLRKVILILSMMLVTSFVGARIFHGLINLDFYRLHPDRWLAFDTQGFALFGGILLATLAGIISCRILKIDFWTLGDWLAPFLGLSIAIIRIGCFLNGCCFGKETELPWGVEFPLFSQAHKYQLAHGSTNLFSVSPVHPTELYELGAALIGSLLALYLLKKKSPAGVTILAFGIWFCIFRLGNYFLRVPAESFDMPLYFYPLFYITLIALGMVAIQKRLVVR